MGLADVFADVFVEPDGGATMADVVTVIAVIAAVAAVCWWLRRKRKREWTAWREEADARLAALAGRDEYQDKALAEIIGPPPRDRQLHAVN